MSRQQSPLSFGFTLIELLAVLAIIAITAAILFPVFFKTHDRSRPGLGCVTNEKQILLAMICYTQDYDERFPPVAAPFMLPNGTQVLEQWGPNVPPQSEGSTIIPSLIGCFIKNAQVFHCPSVPEAKSPLQYRMNDLAACTHMTKLSEATHTVLVMDGDDTLMNFGHSVAVPGEDQKAAYQVSPEGKFTLLRDEAVSPEILVRHSNGCNYGLADGHVKWFKPEAVFFPSRNSQVASHIDPQTKHVDGPDPGGDMTYQGKKYAATFHIR